MHETAKTPHSSSPAACEPLPTSPRHSHGADGVANSRRIQAIGCLGMRACHTNNCPVGIATQREDLRSRLIIETSARQLARFFESSVELMKLLARACGHTDFNQFEIADLTSWKREMSDLSGVHYAGDPDSRS